MVKFSIVKSGSNFEHVPKHVARLKLPRCWIKDRWKQNDESPGPHIHTKLLVDASKYSLNAEPSATYARMYDRV